MNLALLLIAVGALILLNAFFVAAEYGLVTSRRTRLDRKSTRLSSSHTSISYAVFCLDRKSVV